MGRNDAKIRRGVAEAGDTVLWGGGGGGRSEKGQRENWEGCTDNLVSGHREPQRRPCYGKDKKEVNKGRCGREGLSQEKP